MKGILIFCLLILLSDCVKNINTPNNDSEKGEWVNYLNNYWITSIAEEGDYMWIGTYESGLIKIEKSSGNPIFYNMENSIIPSNHIESIAIESNRSKWVGTWGGLVKISGDTWNIYTQSNSNLPASFIRAIAIDLNDTKWIGCSGGLARYDDNLWTVFSRNNSDLPSNEILSLAIDGWKNVWIGTAADPFDPTGKNPIGGLAKFDGTNWTLYNTFNSDINQNWIMSLAVDNNNRIWIGTGMGLNLYDGNKIVRFVSSDSGIPLDCIISLAAENMGGIWIGTQNYGFVEFDGINSSVFNTTNSLLPSNYVQSILVDINDNKWLGTRKGLAVYNRSGIKF
jgi:ligand-binding sensor domain-containing protein